jgi:hypothetical protein
MRIQPTGRELVFAAQAVLRDSVLPETPAHELPTVHRIEAALALAAHKLAHELPALREDLEKLEAARAALRNDLLAQLPKHRQYDARLIAKAIAIAANELANGNAAELDELERLAELMHEAPQSAPTARDVQRKLAALYVRLSADIRAGRCDPGSARYAATCAHLREITRQAVGESNPAYLKTRAGRRDTPRAAP